MKTQILPHTGSRGFSLVELMVATAIGSAVLLATTSLAFFSGRSFAALTNYVELDHFSRNALDVMTKDIRQADRLISGNEHRLDFAMSGGSTLTFLYSPSTLELYRIDSATGERRVLLKECDYLKFSMFQRNSLAGTYDQYPVATPDTCKVIQLHWVCSRKILNKKENTESVQSAKIVIRKQ